MELLDIKIMSHDFPEVITLKDYFKKLLITLWKEGECFSGKRPFGNSGWQYDVYAALIGYKAIDGELDSDFCVEKVDTKKADDFIINLIKSL